MWRIAAFLIFASLIVFLYFQDTSTKDFLAKILRDGDYFLNLVNKQNSLDAYRPRDLTELSGLGAKGKYIREIVYGSLKSLIFDAEKSGASIKIISAYRSYDRQKTIFAFWSKSDKDANRFSAEAGHSEHQLGTTIDFGSGDLGIDLKEIFEDTPQGKWLAENAWKYGFAMSYPRDKEQITGYIYEPWHFRYIGILHAKELRESGITLEEYLSGIRQYYLLIRLGDDYKIYKVEPDGEKRWIKTEDKFLTLGYEWEDVMVVTREEFDSYSEGEAIY